MLPNFYIIGAQKAGTTTLNNLLGNHPEIYMPEDKEIPYFYDNRFYSMGLKNYRWYFRKWDGQPLVGNAPVNLLYLSKITANRMYKYNKKLKLICSLRNPIDRAYSAYWYFKRNLWEKSQTFEQALENEDWIKTNGNLGQRCNLTYIDHGFYYKQLRELQNFFPSECLLIVLFDDLKNNPDKIFRKITEFLEVDHNFEPDFSKKSNVSSYTKNKIVTKLIYKDNYFKNLYKKCIPDRLRYILRYSFWARVNRWNTKAFTKPPMKESTREKLNRVYKDPNKRLEDLLSLDLAQWV